MAFDQIDIRRDVVERLGRAGIDYYVTGSEALALHGIAFRQTNDADFVVAITPADYEARLRPAFEPVYLVSALVTHSPRWLGSAIHVRAVSKADFILRQRGAWADQAFERRITINDPLIGPVWVATLEDLFLAKLEWSAGADDGLQARDIRAITTSPAQLDVDYIRRHAPALGVGGAAQEALRDRA